MIGQTLYAKYILERENTKIIENAHGFLTYKILGTEALIVNLYVDPKSRKSGVCGDLINILETTAQKIGCEFISGSIQLFDPGRNTTMQAALKLGFSIEGANQQSIFIVRKINGGHSNG